MDVVTGAVGSLVSKLVELLNEDYKLQKSVWEKIESLIKELECAHAALRKVAEVPPDQLDDQVRIWAREVRDTSYDMEDEIDTFLVHVDDGDDEHSAGQESFFKRLLDTMRGLIGIPSKRRKISGTIDVINKRLEDVAKRYGRYTIVDSITVDRPTCIDPRLTAMYKEVTDLVGIEKSGSELITMLSTMKMVSIVGVGGLGKTTLAKSVYDNIKVDFECSAFVPVGRNPDLKKVFRDILIEIDKDKYMDHKMAILDERQLIDELRENLRNKRYLLVIDDVWETTSWETIKLALVQKDRGGRVITTTRILNVAKEAGKVYKLQHLSYGASKKLLYTRIFDAKIKCLEYQLDELSDKILKKCDGVPLAIITMASLLAEKTPEEHIELCNSIAFQDRHNKQVGDTEWILSLSYYDLPPPLKTCLLYLSVFPEDQIIDKDSLIWMWVAEGFVHNKLGTSLFEVGNRYFNDLINRSMIQAVETEHDDMVPGVIIGCRVHDMVLDLLRLKSREENFVTISSNNVEAASSPSRVRRLTHHNKMVEHTQMDLGHMRSFIACRCEIIEGFSFQSFKLLRVLSLEHCTLGGDKHYTPICLKHLDNLLHLRYLGLRSSIILEIPEEIGALKFLQTLDLEGALVKRKRLPSNIGLLTKLICLRARHMTVPNRILEKLTSLEQLEICADKDMLGNFVQDLGKLCEVRHLDIELNFEMISFLDKAIWETMALPRYLRCLIVPDLYFTELPSWISSSDLPNLTHLNVSVEYMEEQHLKILGHLPELRHLMLKILSSDSTACTLTITDGGCFQKLRSLSLPNSAVLFVLNEDSSVSFTVGNSTRNLDFGAEKMDKCIVAPAVPMPKLQVLEFLVYLKGEVNNEIVYDNNLGLDCLPSLQSVKVNFSCYSGAPIALRQAIEGHPNRPTLQMRRFGTSNLKRRGCYFGREVLN